MKLRLVEHAVGARCRNPSTRIGPAVAWFHEPQPRQAEISHGACDRTDVVAKLRLDQDHDRPGRFDPALGFVRAGTRHAALLGGKCSKSSPCPSRSLASSGGIASRAYHKAFASGVRML